MFASRSTVRLGLPLLIISIACVSNRSTSASPLGNEKAKPQIAWQPDLEVAKQIAKEENRPLFLAFNMDGESASERITFEEYRDPAFVDATKRCVSVMGSLFRHNPRDYDDQGKRIPCPRLGSVTCGEHIALEPQLFKMLEGERIAPRHAFITPAGEKKFDLSLIFDLHDLDKALLENVKDAPPAKETPTMRQSVVDTWRVLFLGTVNKEHPNRAAMLAQLGVNAKKFGIEKQAAEIVRTALFDCRALPDRMVPAPVEGELALLATLDPEHEMTRFALLALRAVNAAGADAALKSVYGAEVADAIEKTVASSGGPVDVNVLLNYARSYRVNDRLQPKISPKTPPVDELLARIDKAVALLKAKPEDGEAMAELGRASLECARAKIDAGAEGVDLHLGDATMYLGRAREARKDDLSIVLDLAKLAYVKGEFEREEALALEVDARLSPIPDPKHSDENAMTNAFVDSPLRQDTLRWVGDASARLVNSRYGKDPVAQIGGMLRGAHALMYAAVSPQADPVDWQSVISFFTVLGLRGDAALIAEEGVARFTAATEIRQATREVFARIGRPELGVQFSQRELNRDNKSADNAWHLGYDYQLLGDWGRRMEDPALAIENYDRAISAYDQSIALRAEYAASARAQQALAAQGKGFAHLLAQNQERAAASLVEAVKYDPGVTAVRDGLDRETVDLIDNCLEYRIGRPSPVDPVALCEALIQVDPKNPFFATAIADAMLREALRSDGRNDEKDGDRCLDLAIVCGKRAIDVDANDSDTRTTYAQCTTIRGERALSHDDVTTARSNLALAAPYFDLNPPAADANKDALTALAAALRERLGDPRPRFRPGR